MGLECQGLGVARGLQCQGLGVRESEGRHAQAVGGNNAYITLVVTNAMGVGIMFMPALYGYDVRRIT